MNRNFAVIAGVFAVIFLVALARPATAAVTVALLNSTTPTYSGKCATTEAFTGTISGTPGTTFQYSFNRFINSVQQVQNIGAATIPPSGTFSVSDSLSIASSSTGVNFDQIWVHNISGGQSDVYSNKSTFSVTCVTPTNPFAVLHQGTTTLIRPVITLHSVWWAWRKYEYKWVGISSYQPEAGTGPCTDLCVGWNHIHNGDSFWLFHWNYYLRSVMRFDQNLIAGAHPTKATLTVPVTGDTSCFGGLGRATTSWAGGSNDFTAPYPSDSDFSMGVTSQPGPGNMTFDVTSIVQAWANGSFTNNGFVFRGRTEDNGSDGNDSCSVDFGTDGVLTIAQ